MDQASKSGSMIGKTLLISWNIPPDTSGSAVIVGNLAKHFKRTELLLAGERPIGAPGVAWRGEWPELAYIARGWPASWRGARWWRRLQLPIIFLRSVRLAVKGRCTAVVAVFPKEEYLLIGYLTALVRRIPFIPYFHNTWLENRSGLALRLAELLQWRVFKRAEHVFLMSEGMVELYRERYPNLKCSALVHSFNGGLPVFCPPPPPNSPLRITISGSIGETCRDATVRICDAIFQTDDVDLTFLTGTPLSYLAKLGLLRNGVRYETVPTDQVVERLRQSDIVVLPHGFTGGYSSEEYQTIFPTRTIEYLICGRPILAHSPSGCFLTRFLLEHECALVVEEPSLGQLRRAIETLRNDSALRSKLVRNALKAAEQFYAPRVAGALRSQLERIGQK
jgi:glycosyltransferase involved in cell wall biosynthesis